MVQEALMLCVYGKGGIGKSTLSCNISAALADEGLKVMQVGCDPKSDSTASLLRPQQGTQLSTRFIPTILDTMRTNSRVSAKDVIFEGYKGVLCTEAGGPDPGVGCGGRGVIAAIDILENLGVFKNYGLDVVLFDVLGDLVCGGFALPIRKGLAEKVYIVSSAKFMSIYSANNIAIGIQKYSNTGGAQLGGILGNVIDSPIAKTILDEFADKISTKIIGHVPLSNTIMACDLEGKTVIEGAPDSEEAGVFRSMAKYLIEHAKDKVPPPTPFDAFSLRQWGAKWSNEVRAASMVG